DLAHAVDVAADDVAAHPLAELRGTLEVDLGADREGAEGGLGERFGRGVGLEGVGGESVDREADAVDRDRLTELERAERGADEQARVRAPRRARAEDARLLDQAREHAALRSLNRGVRKGGGKEVRFPFMRRAVAVALVVLGCGPSFQVDYEGDQRFE